MKKISKTRLYPDTHLCVDLKVVSRKPGHMYVTASKGGVLQRDGEDHFTFFEDALFEDASVRSAARRRTSYLFRGRYISLTLCADGSLRLNFRRVPMGRGFRVERYALGVYNEICQALCGLVEETAE